MEYLVLVADSFRESVLEELGSRCRVVGETHNAMIVDIAEAKARRLGSARFVYSHFPVLRSARIGRRTGRDYIGFLHRQVKMLGLERSARLRLECYDINCKRGYSAKDIEVRIGTMLEREGHRIDLEHPEVLAYSVLLNGVCYSGYVETLGRRVFVDPFRVYKEKLVSRAEFKMAEAFDTFGLEVPKVAIDIGAAPGGWSLFLARKGAAVIAIDSALLDYSRIRKQGVSVRQVRAVDPGNIRPGAILHIKARLDGAIQLIDGVKADMVMDDINAGGMESAKAVLGCAGALERGSTLIMTVKCLRRNVGKYSREVEALLRPKFRVVQWKVLPHNRQEITLYAVRK